MSTAREEATNGGGASSVDPASDDVRCVAGATAGERGGEHERRGGPGAIPRRGIFPPLHRTRPVFIDGRYSTLTLGTAGGCRRGNC